MKVEDIDVGKIKEMIAGMDDEEIEEIIAKIDNFNYKLNMDSSKHMRHLGIMCLLFVCLDVLLCLILERISVFIIGSIVVCSLTAIFDFHKSSKYRKQAEEYKLNHQ